MPSARREEFTCAWCGVLAYRCTFRFQVATRSGWGTKWRICGHCADWLFALRGNLRWEDLWKPI